MDSGIFMQHGLDRERQLARLEHSPSIIGWVWNRRSTRILSLLFLNQHFLEFVTCTNETVGIPEIPRLRIFFGRNFVGHTKLESLKGLYWHFFSEVFCLVGFILQTLRLSGRPPVFFRHHAAPRAHFLFSPTPEESERTNERETS